MPARLPDLEKTYKITSACPTVKGRLSSIPITTQLSSWREVESRLDMYFSKGRVLYHKIWNVRRACINCISKHHIQCTDSAI